MSGEVKNQDSTSFSALRLWRKAGRSITLEMQGVSMAPLIEQGDTITIRLLEHDRLRIGDLMAFWNGSAVVIHRLIKRRQGMEGVHLCEKGDGLSTWNWIEADRVLGRVVAIGRSGRTIEVTRWPLTWINPIVGFCHGSLITLLELCRPRDDFGAARGSRLIRIANILTGLFLRLFS